MTTAPPICSGKLRWTVQVWPFQCRARDGTPPPVKAQTSAEELAPAATTLSLPWPGNATLVQVEGFDPLRCQAVGAELLSLLSNAQPPFLPTAMTTLKDPAGTRLTIRQAGIMGCALLGAARAG